MAGEGYLAGRGKDAQAHTVPGLCGRGDEHSLREVEFAGDRLHALVVQALCVQEDGERIAGQYLSSDNVDRVEMACHAACGY
jgi:hypothetical protein